MLPTIAFAALGFAVLSHIVSIAVVIVRFRSETPAPSTERERPLVTLIRPLRGLEPGLDRCLESTFHLTYRPLQLLFCVEDEEDRAVPLVRCLIDAHQGMDATLLIGRDDIGANPKVNNLAKGWQAARGEWVILSDSNALLPPDFVQSLRARLDPKAGLVSTAASVIDPIGLAAHTEAAFMNTYQSRWMLYGDALGIAFAQGRTVMLPKETLDAAGGISALAEEAADELAATLLVRHNGKRVRLARHALPQPVGKRPMRTVIRRQMRWAKLRRAGVPLVYATEFTSFPIVIFALAGTLSAAGYLSLLWIGTAIAGWYTLELLLARAANWPSSWRLIGGLVVRDFLLPLVWLAGWFGNSSSWRGRSVSLARRDLSHKHPSPPDGAVDSH